jgi:hypothetical protein
VAFTTSFSVTGPLEAIFDVIPVTRMRVGHQATFSTVTFETNIAVGMASLTGGQVFPRFAGMAAGPLVARQHRIDVASLTLLIIKEGMITTEGAIGEPFTMGLKSQIGAIEVVMALDAELVFMTFVTELRVGARRDRVTDRELGAVNVVHGVAEFSHLVGTTGLVTLKTEILLMTGRAIKALGHRGVAMRQSPGHAVRD